MKKYILLAIAVFSGILGSAQNPRDTFAIRKIQLRPVNILELPGEVHAPYRDLRSDQLRQFDYWMEESSLLSTHKRGGFAFEPILRGQSGDRMNIVIDGMRISGACTDNMDPVTSYIEPANFSSMDISPGGGDLSGSGTAGSINIKTKRPALNQNRVQAELGSEYRSVSNAFFSYARADLSAEKTALSASFTHRTQDPYLDGRGQKVNYTQFTKYNAQFNLIRRISKNNYLSLKYIGDRARDIGYPGLLMDVSRADADIIGLKWHMNRVSPLIRSLKFGMYYSDVYHEMDDTKRPPEEVAMHMDMPGWSSNLGLTADLDFNIGVNSKLKSQTEFYTRNSTAEMTMYPEGEGIMYMMTWPDIQRQVMRTAVGYEKDLASGILGLDANLEYHTVFMDTLLGYRQFSVFGEALDSSNSFLPYSIDLSYDHEISKRSRLLVKAGAASRAPSRSELFGFYLFNAEDGFDYLGNPALKSEQVYRFDLNYSYRSQNHFLKLGIFYNHYTNFIFGEFDELIDGATPGTRGLKRFVNLPSAQFSGAEIDYQFRYKKHLKLRSSLSYLYAWKHDGTALPQIAPLEFSMAPSYQWNKLTLSPRLYANAAQNRIDPSFGEDKTRGWMIADMAVFWEPELSDTYAIRIKAEVSNIFDSYYWGHLDWRNIPRQGRSFNLALTLAFKKPLKQTKENGPELPRYPHNQN